MNQVESKINTLEKLLRSLNDAAYSVLCESNGVSDNEWRVEGGVATPEWPVDSFYAALGRLSVAHSEVKSYFEPEDAEQQQRWANACATASFVVDEFKRENSQLALNFLHRNIADAIYGSLTQTAEERTRGERPQTMEGVLGALAQAINRPDHT